MIIKHFIWALAIIFVVSILAETTLQYNIEQAKQDAFALKACADAGGTFHYSWSRYVCERPK